MRRSLMLLCLLACAMPLPADEQRVEVSPAPQAIKVEGIENFHRVDAGLYNGGQPADEAAFSRLAELGVKTVISVDGARPQVEAARRAGLRYVHIPIGYDGVPKEQLGKLVRAIQESDGPVFVHCHHGNHRSAAAAAATCVATGRMSADQGAKFLKQVGTSPDYGGLWRDVAQARPVPPPPADAPPLPEIAEVPPLAGRMATIDRNFDALQAALRQPQLDAGKRDALAEQAALLAQDFRESNRFAEDYDDYFRDQLKACERLAREIQQAFRAGEQAKGAEQLAEMRRLCVECHTGYRD